MIKKIFISALFISSLFVLSGCGETEQEKYERNRRMQNDEQGRRSQLEQLQADAEPTEIPTPEPTPEPPRDRGSDIIYTTHGSYRVEFGQGNKQQDGTIVYKTVEVDEGEDPADILWVTPHGVMVITEKYQSKVKKLR